MGGIVRTNEQHVSETPINILEGPWAQVTIDQRGFAFWNF